MLTKAVKHCKRPFGRNLVHSSNPVGATTVSGPVEIPIGAFNESGIGLGAMGEIELIERFQCALC